MEEQSLAAIEGMIKQGHGYLTFHESSLLIAEVRRLQAHTKRLEFALDQLMDAKGKG